MSSQVRKEKVWDTEFDSPQSQTFNATPPPLQVATNQNLHDIMSQEAKEMEALTKAANKSLSLVQVRADTPCLSINLFITQSMSHLTSAVLVAIAIVCCTECFLIECYNVCRSKREPSKSCEPNI